MSLAAGSSSLAESLRLTLESGSRQIALRMDAASPSPPYIWKPPILHDLQK